MWKPRGIAIAVGLLVVCSLGEIPGAPAQPSASSSKQKLVYVCACMGNRSCACMTEAMTEGPCSCGTEGGPPLKAVPANSNWARFNRKVLAGGAAQ
ncbi:MAG: hypothetical protein ACRD1Y_02410 [Terriglobales bacterium]